jgi:hypothetical protein
MSQFFGMMELPGPEQEFYSGSRLAYERYTVNVPASRTLWSMT